MASGHALDAPWLAMGVIIGRTIPPFRRQTAQTQSLAWRYVTTRAEHASDPRFVLVEGCPDFVFTTGRARVDKTQFDFQFSCFCKVWAWFGRAITLFPGAAFVGKMEDDSVLHDARVLTELVAAHRAARRAQPEHSPLLWYGHFDWASHRTTADGFRGKHCGVGDTACDTFSHRVPQLFGAWGTRQRAHACCTHRRRQGGLPGAGWVGWWCTCAARAPVSVAPHATAMPQATITS